MLGRRLAEVDVDEEDHGSTEVACIGILPVVSKGMLPQYKKYYVPRARQLASALLCSLNWVIRLDACWQ